MSMMTSVVEGPALYTLIPPEGDPAGTMAALDTIKPSGSFKVETKGCVEPAGQSET